MNRTLLLPFLLAALLGAPAQAQTHDPVFGAYQRVTADAPMVQEARDYLKGHLGQLSLGETTVAYVQVVDGINVKLVCDAVEEGRTTSWKLVAFKNREGKWHLLAAERL